MKKHEVTFAINLGKMIVQLLSFMVFIMFALWGFWSYDFLREIW